MQSWKQKPVAFAIMHLHPPLLLRLKVQHQPGATPLQRPVNPLRIYPYTAILQTGHYPTEMKTHGVRIIKLGNRG